MVLQGGLWRHTQTGYLTTNNGISYDTVGADALHTIHLRHLPLSESVYDSAGALQAQTQFEYDVYSEGLTTSGAVQHDVGFSTAYTTRGNVTATKRWRNTDAALVTTRNQYDDAGNVRKSVDPNGKVTTVSFADSWSNASCAPSGGNGAAYPTVTTSPGTPNVPKNRDSHQFSCLITVIKHENWWLSLFLFLSLFFLFFLFFDGPSGSARIDPSQSSFLLCSFRLRL